MPIYQPSPNVISRFLGGERRSGLSIPISGVVMRVLAQVESTIELTNRICDRYLAEGKHQAIKQVRTSAA
jgi:hypothetical protein